MKVGFFPCPRWAPTMTLPMESSTRQTLLGFLAGNKTDLETVQVFLDKYQPKILQVVRRHGIYGHNAEDLVQEVLQKIFQSFRNFQHRGNGSFRAWLRTVSHSVCIDWLRTSPRFTYELLEDVEKSLTREAEDHYAVELMQSALLKARLEFQQRTWEMFELSKIHGKPAKEIASHFGVSVLTVYGATQRVSRRLNEIFDLLNRLQQNEQP